MNANAISRRALASIPSSSGSNHPLQPAHFKVLILWTLGLVWPAASVAQPQNIDSAKSVMTVRVYRAGVLSALGHDHEIATPVSRGTVDKRKLEVELHTKTNALQVRDAKISEKDRSEIQNTMLGPEVLDAVHNPEISFVSKQVDPLGATSWRVSGDLTLHGQTHPISLDVKESGGHYKGTSHLLQTDFGITPVKVAGGTIRVKDEVEVEFDIQLSGANAGTSGEAGHE